MANPPQTGYQPRNTPAERRAFFQQQRIVDTRATDVDTRLAALEAAVDDLTTRVTDLETP